MPKSSFNERELAHIEDTLIHKRYFMDGAWLLAKRLSDEGNKALALRLLRRAVVHDNSKLDAAEIASFSKIADSIGALKDENSEMSESVRNRVMRHWSANRHHPEYFANPSVEMTKLDKLEMACDWYARSKQYGTDLLKFADVQQERRFHFQPKVFAEVRGYCEMLLTLGDK